MSDASTHPLHGALRIVTVVGLVVLVGAALWWLASGVRSVSPGETAVVQRFGASVRSAGPGLLIAWPNPIETVIIVPSSERPQTTTVSELDALGRAEGRMPVGPGLDPRDDGGYVLSGDAGIAHASADVTWSIRDATQFVAATGGSTSHAEAAIRRMTCAAIIAVAAERSLDGIIVAGSNSDAATAQAAAQSRDRLRAELATALDARLRTLGLGIGCDRVDLTCMLPDAAQPAFAYVASTQQAAAKEQAEALVAAERMRQAAQQASAATIATAEGKAAEQISRMRVIRDRIGALAQERDPGKRALQAERLWRESLDRLAGRTALTLVDGRDPVRILAPAHSESQP